MKTAQSKIILLSSGQVLVEVSEEIAEPELPTKTTWYNQTYRAEKRRTLARITDIEMKLEIPSGFDWSVAGLNQLIAVVFPDGSGLTVWGLLIPKDGGATLRPTNLKPDGWEEGPRLFDAPRPLEECTLEPLEEDE